MQGLTTRKQFGLNHGLNKRVLILPQGYDWALNVAPNLQPACQVLGGGRERVLGWGQGREGARGGWLVLIPTATRGAPTIVCADQRDVPSGADSITPESDYTPRIHPPIGTLERMGSEQPCARGGAERQPGQVSEQQTGVMASEWEGRGGEQGY